MRVLKEFVVGNFMSINEVQRFSMEAISTNDDSRINKFHDNSSLLKVSLLYGSNSSGKSSLIKAMLYSQAIILGLNPIKSYLVDDFKRRLNTDFSFRTTDPEPKSYFEYILQFDDKTYSYGFRIDTQYSIVYDEWIVELKGNKEIVLYEGGIDSVAHSEKDDSLGRQLHLKALCDKDIPNQDTFLKIYRWFEESLIIKTYDSIDRGTTMPISAFKNLIKSMSQYDIWVKKVIIDPIKSDSSGQEPNPYRMDIEVPALKENECFISVTNAHGTNRRDQLEYYENNGKGLKRREILFMHEPGHYTLPYFRESDGTKRLFQFLLLFKSNNDLNNNTDKYPKTIVIDEIDRSIHPEITKKLIRDFVNNNNMGQLIATTHETDLLKVLKKDEIWFVEKKNTNNSLYYSLSEFKIPEDADFKSLYTTGRLGAIPIKPR